MKSKAPYRHVASYEIEAGPISQLKRALSTPMPTPCVLTLEDGIRVDLAAPEPDNPAFEIERIATYLARLPRWLGHTNRPWSVAEHSVWVCDALPLHLKLQGLLHDAPEAIIGDMPSPMKSHLAVYRAWEDALWRAIATRYELPLALDPQVKRLDKQAQAVETRDLRPGAWTDSDGVGAHRPLQPYWQWEDAFELFLDRYAAIQQA